MGCARCVIRPPVLEFAIKNILELIGVLKAGYQRGRTEVESLLTNKNILIMMVLYNYKNIL